MAAAVIFNKFQAVQTPRTVWEPLLESVLSSPSVWFSRRCFLSLTLGMLPLGARRWSWLVGPPPHPGSRRFLAGGLAAMDGHQGTRGSGREPDEGKALLLVAGAGQECVCGKKE